jgi:hypothetical protein
MVLTSIAVTAGRFSSCRTSTMNHLPAGSAVPRTLGRGDQDARRGETRTPSRPAPIAACGIAATGVN